MSLSISTGLATAQANNITAAISAGAAAGTLKVYTGAKPASVATAPSGTLLGTFTLDDPVAAAAVAGVADWDFVDPIAATVVADGDAGWFRTADSDGNGVFDGTVGTDLTFDSTSWLTGGTVELAGGTVSQPLSS